MYKGITTLNNKDKTFAKVSKDEERVYAGYENHQYCSYNGWDDWLYAPN